jgi:GMP synthase (glutamine-hydrolysing)
LIVMGGTMNVDDIESYPFLGSSRRFMSSAVEQEVPTLGVCLGAQMMSRVFGGDVRRAEPRNATFSALKVTDEGEKDPLIQPFANAIPVLQFHEDTFTFPEGAIPLATSGSSGLPQAFRYGANAYAIQFHFEVDDSILRGWMDDIGTEAMVEGWGTTPDELARVGASSFEGQSRAGRELVRRFLDLLDR